MKLFSSLKREQKEAIGLLQIGTFLEYFDLMLYVHMAVLLNELFFPKTDPHTAALLSAFAFCSTFVLRPFGALVFGYIGDHIGRKTTVIITTMMMSTSCVIMANLPTYAQVGITATWFVTICRIVQGLSSMGEIIGCQIYITEITKPPAQYPAVAFIGVASSIGAVAALGVASLVTTTGFNWRIAFWIGAGIAVIGSIARIRLRETPEFVDKKRQLQKEIEEDILDESAREFKLTTMKRFIEKKQKQKISKTTLVSCFFIYCGWPLSFYLGFMYFTPILKEVYGYSSENIIFHNFFLSIVMLLNSASWSILSYKIHPLKILKLKAQAFGFLTLFLPFLILKASHSYQIFALQSILLIVSLGANPADSVFIKHFPVFKRFTTTSFLYALSRALMYIFTSFGLVYFTESLGQWGIWLVMLPATVGFIAGVHHFEKLEKISKVAKHTSIFQNINWLHIFRRRKDQENKAF